MNIEEAFQKLKRLELQDFGKKRKFELKESEVAYITVSNELEKKDKQIEEAYKEGYRKGALPQVLENWNNENARIVKINKIEEKKDKVIDMIVNTIVGDRKILKLMCNKIINKKEDECFEQNKLCDDCIKEYFYNKVEIPEKN